MTYFFFWNPKRQFDVYLPGPVGDVPDDKPRRKKRKTFTVRRKRRTVIAREVELRPSAIEAVQEQFRQERLAKISEKRQTQTKQLIRILEILDFLDDEDG